MPAAGLQQGRQVIDLSFLLNHASHVLATRMTAAFAEIGITPLSFENTFYCSRCASMASYKTCPHTDADRLLLSGTKVREMLRRGEAPPPEFTRPEIATILVRAMRDAK